MIQPLSVGLYIHWPFCRTLCPYCAFNSYIMNPNEDWIDSYCKALIMQLKALKKISPYTNIHSIYFGGGTPSLIPIGMLDRLIKKINQLYFIPSNAEITLECNPTYLKKQDFRDWKICGINRLSMGVQSMDDTTLRRLGRRHTIVQALNMYEQASVVFHNISVDLIYAHPWHNISTWKEELHHAIHTFQPPHFSLYELTIEEGTPFFKLKNDKKLNMPIESMAGIFFLQTHRWMKKWGYDSYEISNYAKHPKYQGMHNVGYWQYDPFFGLGPGAHGRFICESQDGEQGNYVESHGLSHPNTWLQKTLENPLSSMKINSLSLQQQWEEIVLMGLRTKKGLSQKFLKTKIGYDFTHFNQESLYIFKKYGYIEENTLQHSIKLSFQGWLRFNTVVQGLLQ